MSSSGATLPPEKRQQLSDHGDPYFSCVFSHFLLAPLTPAGLIRPESNDLKFRTKQQQTHTALWQKHSPNHRSLRRSPKRTGSPRNKPLRFSTASPSWHTNKPKTNSRFRASVSSSW